MIGVPNVGKSSLINALRRTHLKKGIHSIIFFLIDYRLCQTKITYNGGSLVLHVRSFNCAFHLMFTGKASRVGAVAGVTRSVMEKIKVSRISKQN